MHGIEHSHPEVLDVSPFGSTIAVFAGYRFKAAKLAAICFRTEPFARKGLSWLRKLHPVARVSSPSPLPVCYFALSTSRFRCPFGLSAPQPASGLHSGSDCFHASGPLPLPRPALPAAPLILLPFGSFASLRIDA